MNKEDLKKLGLTDEAVMDQIIVLHGKDIEVHKGKLTTAEVSLKTATDQLTEANKQIEGFKGMNIDQIKASADEWKTKAEKAQTDAAAQLSALKFDHALDGALSGAKAKDVIAIKAHLKMDALKLNDDGTILGLKEQLEPLQKDKDYLFESDDKTPVITTGGKTQPIIGDKAVIAARTAMGLPAAEGK